MIDLDANATTRPSDAVIEGVADAMRRHWHNPSSLHRPGQSARRAVESARASIAELIGARPRELTITSSGTEAVQLAILGAIGARTESVLVTCELEHPAGLDAAERLEQHGVEIRRIPVLPSGVVDVGALPALLPGAALVSVPWVNSETGVVQPVHEIGAECRRAGVPFHCDAVQWAGRQPTDLGALDAPAIDLLSLSPHKFHGPKGVGALWARPGHTLRPVIPGSQELGRRGGTEGVPAIVGAGIAAREAAARLLDPGAPDRTRAQRDRIESALLEAIEGATVAGAGAPRAANTSQLILPGIDAEPVLLALSERGVAASSGSACSSGSVEPSRALLAMGYSEAQALGALRLSLPDDADDQDLDRAVGLIVRAVAAATA